jgi:predicted RNA binding protein YcfA (HicA-like mRNA interferase family)
MNKKQMLQKLRKGKSNTNLSFFKRVLKAFGFIYLRTEGSHQIYENKDIDETIVIQPHWKKHGQAKSYQIEEFLSIVKEHNL